MEELKCVADQIDLLELRLKVLRTRRDELAMMVVAEGIHSFRAVARVANVSDTHLHNVEKRLVK